MGESSAVIQARSLERREAPAGDSDVAQRHPPPARAPGLGWVILGRLCRRLSDRCRPRAPAPIDTGAPAAVARRHRGGLDGSARSLRGQDAPSARTMGPAWGSGGFRTFGPGERRPLCGRSYGQRHRNPAGGRREVRLRSIGSGHRVSWRWGHLADPPLCRATTSGNWRRSTWTSSPGAVAKITASSLAEGPRLTSMRLQNHSSNAPAKYTPGRCRVGAPLRIGDTSQCHARRSARHAPGEPPM